VAADGISITGGPDHQQVTLRQDGQTVATADVDFTAGPQAVHAVLHGRVQPLPPHTGGRLVDAVVDLLEAAGTVRVDAAVPAVDADLVQRLRERTHDLSTRRAGTTVLITAHPQPTTHEPATHPTPSPAGPSTPDTDQP